LSIPFQIKFSKPENIFFDNYIYTKPAVFGSITGHKELLKSELIEYLNFYKEEGTSIGIEMSSNNRVGVYTFKAANRNSIVNKMKETINIIDVLDIDGNSIMIKNIYEPFFDKYD
jgi:hypothetical protein